MALQKTVSFEKKHQVQSASEKMVWHVEDVTFDAYIKVSFVSGNKSQVTANVLFVGEGNYFEKSYNFQANISDGSSNFIQQAYEHLKTLPEFAGAADV